MLIFKAVPDIPSHFLLLTSTYFTCIHFCLFKKNILYMPANNVGMIIFHNLKMRKLMHKMWQTCQDHIGSSVELAIESRKSGSKLILLTTIPPRSKLSISPLKQYLGTQIQPDYALIWKRKMNTNWMRNVLKTFRRLEVYALTIQGHFYRHTVVPFKIKDK